MLTRRLAVSSHPYAVQRGNPTLIRRGSAALRGALPWCRISAGNKYFLISGGASAPPISRACGRPPGRPAASSIAALRGWVKPPRPPRSQSRATLTPPAAFPTLVPVTWCWGACRDVRRA